ncbi:MAG TPA: ribbon-helix-helix domain-containing protein [Hyphomicrobiaceae bacterium]|jgi:hypothetical protein
MIKKPQQDQNRDGILRTLTRFGGGRLPTPGSDTKAYVAPSRERRKPLTTWQDEVALKELRDLSHETGRKQQELVAEALNMLFVKHGKRRVAR